MLKTKISVYIATSIDGYIARADGSVDWLECVQGYEDDYGFHQFFGSIDALILGRNTYDVAASAPDWPYPGKRVIVLSHRLQSVRPEAELYRGDIATLIARLHSQGIKHIWVDGGATISQFIKSQMVDSMTLSVIPVVLGSGIRLFQDIEEFPCELISSQSYPSGLVQLRYKL